MKIGIKNELHSIVSLLQVELSARDISVKSSSLKEVFAHVLGHRDYSGLLSHLPKDISITDDMERDFQATLKTKHHLSNEKVSCLQWLSYIEDKSMSYSTKWNADARCYPRSLNEGENYWYLTKEGWKQWSEMDFNKSRVELDIFEVVKSYHYSDFAGAFSIGPSARPIWDASIARKEFEIEAEKLIREYGEWPIFR